MGQVFLAAEADVAIALRMDGYLKEGASTGIPIGVYRAGATDSTIYLDADFLLGPEAAHLNISGMSGLATKTSAVEWLLSSVFTHFPESKGSIAAVCFNVKGPDLCFIDQPGRARRARSAPYDQMGVTPKPFEQRALLRAIHGEGLLAQHASHPTRRSLDNVEPLMWGLREVLKYAEVLLNRDDIDAKADAFIDFIAERVLDKRVRRRTHSRATTPGSVLRRSRGVVPAICSTVSSGRTRTSWRTHHIATIRKVRNRLSNISTRCAGLVTDTGMVSDLPFGSFEDRTVYVVDVATLEEDAQDLDLCAHCLQASRTSRAARPGCQTSHCIRGRAQQIRAR